VSPTSVTSADEHRRVAAAFTATVEGVPASGWDLPAPPEGWVARDVVRHLVTWFPAFLQHATGITPPAGPSVDEDPVGAWRAQTEAVQALLDDPTTAGREHDLPHIGRMTLAQAVDMIYTGDVFLHRWDLARAVRVPCQSQLGTDPPQLRPVRRSQCSTSSVARGSASRFRSRCSRNDVFGFTRSMGTPTKPSSSTAYATGTASTPRSACTVHRIPWSCAAASAPRRRRASSSPEDAAHGNPSSGSTTGRIYVRGGTRVRINRRPPSREPAMNLAVWVERTAAVRPDEPALADGERVHASWRSSPQPRPARRPGCATSSAWCPATGSPS
jgi:hypothetical protein